MDHSFVLHALTEIAKTKKKKLFCSFIDFSKAFDSVWRVGLWKKLLASNINGKCFQFFFSTCTRELTHVSHIMESNLNSQVFEA